MPLTAICCFCGKTHTDTCAISGTLKTAKRDTTMLFLTVTIVVFYAAQTS
jgi:hypothetical protein